MSMTTPDPQQLPSTAFGLLEAALEQSPDQRSDWIKRASGSDAVLRNAALALLDAHARSEGFLEPVSAPLPRELGPYRLIETLGAGGMGQVWLAERRDGAFQQRVAIKVLASTLGDPDSIRRAERERQFLAWLEHPHIARVLDGGTTPEGQPYVVMEYISGEPIDAWCRRRGSDLQQRVQLFQQVLSAVDAAHRALIIHRDIKPSNILVDADGQAKLLDFGIAKSLDERMDAMTRSGLLPMTPQYASPEQLLGQPLTTACDIYALGLVLDELLTGRALHAGLTTVDLLHAVDEPSPSRPSSRIDAAGLQVSAREARHWRRRLHGDLDRVVQMALATEPGRRYDSARAFADDLQRWLEYRPVRARSSNVGYRLVKFMRRNRWAVSASLAAVLALLLGFGIAYDQARRAAAEGERAVRANRFLTDMIARADPFRGGKPPLLVDALDRAVIGIPHALAGQPLLEADIRHAIGRAYLALERNDAAQEQLQRAAQLREPAGGTAYAQALDSQATLEWQLGRYENAERLFVAGLSHAGSDTAGLSQRSELLNDLAALLNDVGRYADALPLIEEALRLKSHLPDQPARELGISLGNLAATLDGLGRLDPSETRYREALAVLESIAPPPQLDIAIALNNLAYVQEERGQIEQAVLTQERAVAIYRAVMGPDYPRLAVQLSNLALRYVKLGRMAEADIAMNDALRIGPSAFGAGDQKFANLQVAAARVALARNDAEAAQRLVTQALAIYDRAEALEPGRRDKAAALLAQARVALAVKP